MTAFESWEVLFSICSAFYQLLTLEYSVWIIVFKESATEEQKEDFIRLLEEHGEVYALLLPFYRSPNSQTGGTVINRYTVINGISAEVSDSFIKSFGNDEIIDYVG